MALDDVLRQAQAIAAQADQRRSSHDAGQRAKREAEEDFRESLREFGRWFCTEARSRGLATIPFYAEPPEYVPPKYSKGFLGFAYRVLEPEKWIQTPTVDHGWAIIPMTGSGYYTGRAGQVGRRPFYGDLADTIEVRPCLAVDTSGKVRRALTTSGEV